MEQQLTKTETFPISSLIGTWEGTSKVWFEPDVVADESPCKGTIRQGVNNNSVIHEYEGAMQGKPLKGLAIYTVNPKTGECQAAWIDGFHMSAGILFSEGGSGGGGIKGGFKALGSFGSPGEKWGWRTEIEMPDQNKLIITAYLIMPQGEEQKATETILNRI